MKPLQKWLLMGSSLITGLTGVVYFWMKRFLVPVDPFAVVGHPLEPWMLKAHILAAPVLVFAVGLVTTDHIWKNYRCLIPAGRRSGIAATVMIVPMVVTGYVIQAVTSVGWLTALGWAHLGFGLLYLASLLAHQQLFRRWTKVAGTLLRARRHEGKGRRLPVSTRPPSPLDGTPLPDARAAGARPNPRRTTAR